jgi:uroporphyrinogen-III synthase
VTTGSAQRRARGAAPSRRGRRPDPGKRERIIEAASGLFGGRDLASVRMEEVAARAGVAKGTVYLYFQSKEDLYFSILAARLSVLLDALDQAFREEEDPRVRLRKFLVHSSMFLLKYPDFFRMMGKEESRLAGAAPGREAEVEPLRARLRNLLRGLLLRGMEAGRVRRMPVEMAADIVFGALEGTVRRCLAEGCTPQRHSQAPALLCEFVWRALRTEELDIAEIATAQPREAAGVAGDRLDGAVVLVTREEGSSEGLSAEIARLGGRPFSVPVLRTASPADTAALHATVHAVASYAWILFTSARGVESFAAAWREAGRPGIPAATRIGAVGPATARRAVERLGRCDCIASDARGTGLAHELLRRESLRGTRVLLVRAEEGLAGLQETLRQADVLVEEVVAYRTVPAVIDASPIRAALHRGSIAAVAFASPSAVQAFVGQVGATWLGGPDGRTRIVTIGPSTSLAVRSLGLEPSAEADAPSFSELARAAARAIHTQQGATP